MQGNRRFRWVLMACAALLFVAAAVFLVANGMRARADGGPALSHQDIETITHQAVATANTTPSGLRGAGRTTKMVIAVVARDGKLLNVYSMPDAWVGSIDIAIAKARTAAFFSSNENAITSRVIGNLSQAHDPTTGNGPAQPLWGIWASNQVGITGSPEYRNGIITFPGGAPLYKGSTLVGGVGVSGDGVDQDEAVSFGGQAGFTPGPGVTKNY